LGRRPRPAPSSPRGTPLPAPLPPPSPIPRKPRRHLAPSRPNHTSIAAVDPAPSRSPGRASVAAADSDTQAAGTGGEREQRGREGGRKRWGEEETKSLSVISKASKSRDWPGVRQRLRVTANDAAGEGCCLLRPAVAAALRVHYFSLLPVSVRFPLAAGRAGPRRPFLSLEMAACALSWPLPGASF
jgi:hypothetical protein